MQFILNLAYREMRSSWRRLIFFFLCIAIGTGSIVALRSLLQNLKVAVNREARALLTADVQVSANTLPEEAIRQRLKQILNAPDVIAQSEMLETATMVRSAKDAQITPKLVEFKAVQADFPYYGAMVMSEGASYRHDLLKGRGLIARQSLLTALNVNIGDQVIVNEQAFTIRGVIEKEPGSSIGGFSFAQRAFMDYDDAVAAGLLGFGSRARYRLLVKTRDNTAQALEEKLKQAFRQDAFLSIRSFRSTQDRLSNSLTRVEDFLSLIGLVILVLGGIGISSVTRVFINQKMKTIAILKTLGSRNASVLAIYLTQVLLLGLLGSLLGLALAKLTVIAVPAYFKGRLPLDIEFTLTWSAMAQGLGIGILISLLFSLLPLLEIRRIKPILVIRSGAIPDAEHQAWWRDRLRIAVSLLVTVGLLALASWQAGSLKVGAIFLAGLSAMTLVLNRAAWLLMRWLKGLRALPSFAVRQGVNSLYRPGNQTRIILLAVGLGVFFIVAVRLLQINLLDEFAIDLNAAERADLYLVDIQRDQLEPLRAFVKNATGAEPQLIPTIRSRINQINGKDVNPDRVEINDQRGLLGREYVLTYRNALDEVETTLAGQFWNSPTTDEPEISIEELLNKELKLQLNDRVTFDVLGKQITARVSHIRRVDWRNARTGFLVVFRPGPLDNAPTMWVSAIKGPAPNTADKARARFQRDLVAAFPNVAYIDVFDLLEVARDLIGNVSLTVSFVGGFVFLSGVLILIGSIAMTKFHRLYESAILKTLGAKRKLIVTILLVEYGVLGLLAGALGSSAAIALTWAVCKYGLEIGWRFIPSVNLLGMALAALVVMSVGVVSSWDVLVKKPLGILRAE